MAASQKPTQTSGSPFFGRRAVYGIALAAAAVVLVIKFAFLSDPKEESLSPQSATAREEKESGKTLEPRGLESENLLLFGGALQKVEDFVPFQQTVEFLTVLRDVSNADAKTFENAALLESYASVMESPRHLRFSGRPVRFRGVMGEWYAHKTEPGPLAADSFFQSWVLRDDDLFTVFSTERPPVTEQGFGKSVVEVTGFFYQITSYAAKETLREHFGKAAANLKQGNHAEALKKFQRILAQDPNPALIARYLSPKLIDPSLWDAFIKQGPEYRGAYERITELGNRGAERVLEAVPEESMKAFAPLFVAKSIHVVSGRELETAMDRFFGSFSGMLALLAAVAALVGAFFYFFLKMQKTQDDRLKREREEFWREVRRNVKGVTPPGDRFGRGGSAPPI